MILHEFPDITWLKRQIDLQFRDRKAFNGLELESEGFPSVVINTKIKESYRPDIKGPVSVFANLKGSSRCKVGNRTVIIPESSFFITNRFQHYTLEIEDHTEVETFNVHMGEYFSEGVLSSILTPVDKLLNENVHQPMGHVLFSNQLYERDTGFNSLVQRIKGSDGSKLLFEEGMYNLLVYLLHRHRSVIKSINDLPAAKQSTKIDLYKRLAIVVDYLKSTEDYTIDLNALASLACLSKYHFLRLFKQAYNMSPYQYIQQLKLEKAKNMLASNAMTVKEIAAQLGFENSNSFSRLFHQRTGKYPVDYRKEKISNFGY